MRNFITFGAVAATILAGVSGAEALTRVPQPATLQQAGTLTCNIAPGLGLGFGSSREANCIFDHVGTNGFSEAYKGKLSRIGVDVGVMGVQSLKFSVLTPGGAASPGILSGTHLGASKEASFLKAPGVQVSFASGGAQGVVFQQSGETSWVGVNVGFGDTSLELGAPSEL